MKWLLRSCVVVLVLALVMTGCTTTTTPEDLNLNFQDTEVDDQYNALIEGTADADDVRDVMQLIGQQPNMQYVLLIGLLPVLLLAGLSEAIAQSIVLFANQVRPLRFIAVILLNSTVFILIYLNWVFSIWVLSKYVLGLDQVVVIVPVMVVVAAAYTPLYFAFLGIIPYFGRGIIAFLYLLVFLGLIEGLTTVFVISTEEAFFVSFFGLIVQQVLQATVGRPITWLTQRVRRFVAGTEIEPELRRAVERTVAEVPPVVLPRGRDS